MGLDKTIKKQLSKLLKYTEAVREEIHGDIPQQQMLMLLFIAMNEGITQGEISRNLDIPEGTVSRNMYKLGTKYRRLPDGSLERKGLGLIESRQEDLADTRKKSVYLTEKGVRAIKILGSTIKEGC